MKRSRADAVEEYLNGRLEKRDMSLPEEEYLSWMMACYRLMVEGQTKTFIRRYLSEEFMLGYAEQYRVEKDTARVFGQVNKINRTIEQHIAIEMAKEAFQQAKDKSQVGLMIKAQQAFVKALGDDPGETPDFQKIQPSLIIAALPEGMNEQMQLLLSQGHVNLNKAPQTIEIPYQDVSESESTD